MAFAEIIEGVIVTINRTGVADAGQVEVPDSVMPGDLDNGDGTFSRPTPPPPTQDEQFPPLFPYQFHALVEYNNLSGSIEAAFQSMEQADPLVAAVARAKYATMGQFNRSDPLLNAMAAAIGLSELDLDTLWTLGGQL